MWQQQQYYQSMAQRNQQMRPSSRAQSEYGGENILEWNKKLARQMKESSTFPKTIAGTSRYQSYCTLPRPDVYFAAANTGVDFPVTLDPEQHLKNSKTDGAKMDYHEQQQHMDMQHQMFMDEQMVSLIKFF